MYAQLEPATVPAACKLLPRTRPATYPLRQESASELRPATRASASAARAAAHMPRACASVAALVLACCGACSCVRLTPMRPHALPLLVATTRPRVPPVLLAPSAVGPLLTTSAAAAVALQDSAVGRAVSPPMLAFAFALGLSNAGLLPTAHPLYAAVSSHALPLAVALSLISAAGGALEPAAAAGSPGPSPLRP